MPFVHELRQRSLFALRLFGAEKMDMVGHDDIAADKSSMTVFRRLPLAEKDAGRNGGGQDWFATMRANGHEVDRAGYPDPAQSSQMLMFCHENRE